MSRLHTVIPACILTIACAACGITGESSYQVTAMFPKAPSFYAGSPVKLMGATVGEVTSVRIAGDRVRVAFTVRKKVALPTDVRAAITPLGLLGERVLVLGPPRRPGQATLPAGGVIPLERTDNPAEVDEAVAAMNKLAAAVDPGQMGTLVDSTAGLLKGRGQSLNRALELAGDAGTQVAAHDKDLVALARQTDQLIKQMRGKDGDLAKQINVISSATGILADERKSIAGLLHGTATLAGAGDRLMRTYQGQFPGDLAVLRDLSMTLGANRDSLIRSLRGIPGVLNVFLRGYDPELRVERARLVLNGMAVTWLKPILKSLGRDFDCLPKPFGECIPGPADGGKER